ncbi:hypothetical protein GUJ93_ZPchr2158g41 [Zizania palustris]|uniref:Uncharacterized protein n=1 Tax=Zizania palustris TaxID=103762 RepID=A0A8J5V8W5_ZIZPA|nr:hypothetical protein GUJ93_ZPchr0004g39495 [Zizania palustris]KAG8100877.1 hypothetical protein GUJ93_ZPchr2158g41 [Zizania palustris]
MARGGGRKPGRHAEATATLFSFSSACRVGLYGMRRKREGEEAARWRRRREAREARGGGGKAGRHAEAMAALL